jgi:four helix bundle protein
MELVVEAYRLADKLPSSERFELSAQIRRAAVSIPSNVAEGHERRNKGYLHHLRIALGSLAELETQTEVALRLGFLQQVDVAGLANKAAVEARLLHGLKVRRCVERQLVAKAYRRAQSCSSA